MTTQTNEELSPTIRGDEVTLPLAQYLGLIGQLATWRDGSEEKLSRDEEVATLRKRVIEMAREHRTVSVLTTDDNVVLGVFLKGDAQDFAEEYAPDSVWSWECRFDLPHPAWEGKAEGNEVAYRITEVAFFAGTE